MQHYNIVINEHQRKLLITALLNLDPSFDTSSKDDLDQVSAVDTASLLEGMPDIEKDHPGILHGLCL